MPAGWSGVAPENDATEGSQTVRDGAGNEHALRDAELRQTRLIPQTAVWPRNQIGVGAQNRGNIQNVHVENGVVEIRVPDVAQMVRTLCQDHRLLGKSPIAGNALIHQLLRLGKRITRNHRGQEGIAGGTTGGAWRKTASLAA